jgi:hypothetical protein
MQVCLVFRQQRVVYCVNPVSTVGDGLLRWDVQSIAKKPDRQFFAERGRHAAAGYQKLGGG